MQEYVQVLFCKKTYMPHTYKYLGGHLHKYFINTFMWTFASFFFSPDRNQYRYALKQGKNGSPLGRGCLRGWDEPSIFLLGSFHYFLNSLIRILYFISIYCA